MFNLKFGELLSKLVSIIFIDFLSEDEIKFLYYIVFGGVIV